MVNIGISFQLQLRLLKPEVTWFDVNLARYADSIADIDILSTVLFII